VAADEVEASTGSDVGWTTFAGVGGLVRHDGKLLMIKQRRPYGVHWELPSGYYEPGESFEQGTVREVLEETGIPVDVAGFVCTLVWQREHDRRRNVLAFFEAAPVDTAAEPQPQREEGIEEARYVEPRGVEAEIHPLYVPILERWWSTRTIGFHVHADVTVHPDGTQSYVFRDADAS
jgi:ADP-ribose pyrophosphatase YjhB (NUDIX family)